MSDEMDIGVLAGSFNEFLTAEWPREKSVAFARADNIYADDLWSQVTALGWTALTVPEEAGGLGLGMTAIAALHEAIGAAAAPLPIMSNNLADLLIETAGTDAQKEALRPELAAGTLRAALASLSSVSLNADGATLNGIVADVLDAPSANLIFLRASKADRQVWISLSVDTPGVSITRIPLADTTRSLGTVTLKNVAIADANVFSPSDPSALDDELLRLAAIAIAADAIGGGEAVLATTIDFMKVREQFDRVIGSFQALKHRVADHKAALVAARGLLEHAASLDPKDPGALLAALSAKQHLTRTVAEVARDCIQLHGGVGYTSEYIPHIYLKRAKLNEVLFGTRDALLDRIADMLEAA